MYFIFNIDYLNFYLRYYDRVRFLIDGWNDCYYQLVQIFIHNSKLDVSVFIISKYFNLSRQHAAIFTSVEYRFIDNIK